MTPKSTLSPHFRGDICTTTIIRSILDCSTLRELYSYNNNILNGIVIEKMTCIIKLVSTIILKLNSFFYFETKNSKLLNSISIFLYYVHTESLVVQQTSNNCWIDTFIIFSSDYNEMAIFNCPEGKKRIIVASFNTNHFYFMKVDFKNQLIWTIIIQVRIKSDINHHSDIHQPRSGVCKEERKDSSDVF